MKKFLLTLFSIFVLVVTLTLSVVAANVASFESNYIQEGDFVIASFNGVRDFVGDAKNPESLENACYWLTDYKDTYNIKFVGFVGEISSDPAYLHGAPYKYDALIQANLGDVEWKADFELLWDTASILTQAGIPYGVNIGHTDLCAKGMYRNNHIPSVFEASDYIDGTGAKIESYDPNNYAVIFSSGDQDYIMYNLEVYPREAILNWLLETNAKHTDKRAIVFTSSFLNSTGMLYTQWDISETILPAANLRGTTRLKGGAYPNNIVNYDKPRDGDQLWNYALSKIDNLLCVVSAQASTGNKIVTTTLKNANGYDVAAIVADLTSAYGPDGKAYPVMIKISEDNKSLDVRFAAPYENGKGGYVKESKVTISLNNIAPLTEANPLYNLPKISTQVNGDNTAYINGYANNIFKPNANMTKAEACTIIARLLTGTQQIPDGYTTKFTDVKESDWFFNAIAYLDSKGFFYDKSGKYEPNKNITRAEFAELAYRACNLKATKSVTFKDVNEKNPNYDAIMAAAAAGLINGYEDSTFRPNNNITRAEVVTIVNRVLGLYVDKVAIDKTHLSKIFTDITGHWAEYQILMASNDKVHSAAYYNADLGDMKMSGNEIVFSTKHIEVKINKNTGNVTGLKNLETGKSILATSTTPWFTYAISTSNSFLSPKSIELVDGRLKAIYRGGVTAYFLVETFDNYFTVTLDSHLPDEIKGVVFGNLSADYEYNYDDENTYALSAMTMNTNTDPTHYPGGSVKATKGTVYTDIKGAKSFGAKLGVTFSKQGVHREYLKEITDQIDPNVGIVSTKGGAYAYDSKEISTDYGILLGKTVLTPSNVEEYAKLANDSDIDYLDLHHGQGLFIQGDFNFVGARTSTEKRNNTFITAKVYKERILDVLEKYGVGASLHTFSSLVSPEAETILSNPVYQQQICYLEDSYTLRGDLDARKTSVKTYEDVSKLKIPDGFSDYGTESAYFLIDEEIIKVSKGSTSGFIGVTRGTCGTKATTHKDGAVLRHLTGWYSGAQTIPGSDLFYQVAKNIAKAVNEGGFEMVYLDAFESIDYSPWTEDHESFYWYGEFVRTILLYSEVDPILEMSTVEHAAWAGISRTGQLDYATANYKPFKENQINTRAIPFMQSYLGANIGWVHFAPDTNQLYKNTYYDTMFRDDLDHMGSLSIAYDTNMVTNPFGLNYTKYPQFMSNVKYYSLYSRLRKANYFAPEVKEQIKNGEYEYKVIKQADGTWAFREMNYLESIVFDGKDSLYQTFRGTNPFEKQKPFIRIEQRFSTLGEGEKLVYDFDENTEVSALVEKGKLTLSSKMNLAETPAFKINVCGNSSQDSAICIRIMSGSDVVSFIIPTNFSGWKEFTLMEDDDVKYNNYDFGITNSKRPLNNLNSIDAVRVYTSGNCSGVKLGDLKAYTVNKGNVKNPLLPLVMRR